VDNKHAARQQISRKSPPSRYRSWLVEIEAFHFAATFGRMTILILKRATASRPSGEWNDDDYDVLADGFAVGRIFKVNAAPIDMPWMWTLAFEHHQNRTPTHGYAETREAAMTAFAKSCRRQF
jgi:hypothetical protein